MVRVPIGLVTQVLSPLTDGQSMAIVIYMITLINDCFQKVTRVSGTGFASWLDRGSLAAALVEPNIRREKSQTHLHATTRYCQVHALLIHLTVPAMEYVVPI